MSINWFSSMFTSKEEQKNKQLEELSKTEDFKNMVEEAARSIIEDNARQQEESEAQQKAEDQEKIEKAKQYVDTISDSMRESNEPYVSVMSAGIDPQNGIMIKLDWNDAFIRYLNSVGIKGPNPEETIRTWLGYLNYDIEQEVLAEDYIANGVSDDDIPDMSYEEMFGSDDEEDGD